jgi:hypothetical protein
MSKHLEELEEISRLRLGIILLIKELEKNRQLEPIYMYLKDLIEGVDESTIKQKQANFDNFMKDLESKKVRNNGIMD